MVPPNPAPAVPAPPNSAPPVVLVEGFPNRPPDGVAVPKADGVPNPDVGAVMTIYRQVEVGLDKNKFLSTKL